MNDQALTVNLLPDMRRVCLAARNNGCEIIALMSPAYARHIAGLLLKCADDAEPESAGIAEEPGYGSGPCCSCPPPESSGTGEDFQSCGLKWHPWATLKAANLSAGQKVRWLTESERAGRKEYQDQILAAGDFVGDEAYLAGWWPVDSEGRDL